MVCIPDNMRDVVLDISNFKKNISKVVLEWENKTVLSFEQLLSKNLIVW